MSKRIGIIGLGDIAQKVYLPLLSARQGVEIAAIMSTTPSTVDRVQQQYRLPFGTTKMEQFLAQRLDAVFVHSPTPSHYSIVMQCLEQGIPVYVDKPLSYDFEESVQMASFAKTKGVLLGVGFNRRFAPRYKDAKQWLEESGGFAWGTVQKHRTGQQKLSAKQTYYDDLIHILDLLLWLGGNSYNIVAASQQIDSEGRLLHATGMLDFGMKQGAYSMVRHAGLDLEKLELHGSGRSVEVTNMEAAVFYEKGAHPQSYTFGSWDTILYRRGFQGVVDHFLDSLDSPDQCTIRADLVLESHRLVEQLT